MEKGVLFKMHGATARANNTEAQQPVQHCQSKLPPDSENPAKEEIEQEIEELEYRLTQLKQSIGVT